jgi:hypothetical protein
LGSGGLISVAEAISMRFAGNFHPEWGYLAPAPGFMRSARLAIVAAVVGATAGAGVVLSLIDRPAETSVAARTLVRPVVAVVPAQFGASPAPLAQASSEKQPATPALAIASASAESPIGSETSRGATAPAPAAIAALVESPAVSDGGVTPTAAELKPAPAPAPTADIGAARKKAKAKRSNSRDSWRDDFLRNDYWRNGSRGPAPGEYSTRGASRWADRDAWGGYDLERYRYR